MKISLSARIAEHGEWEAQESAAVRDLVRPGHVCIDIGANVGYFSLLMASLGAKVSAFEPTTYGYQRFLQNLGLNLELAGRIMVHKIGLARTTLVQESAIEAQFSLRVASYSERETILFKPLDSIWCGPVDFVKIDVDGHDLAVIQGARETLKGKPVVMAEFESAALERNGATVRELVGEYIALGYTQCKILASGETLRLRDVPSSMYGNVLLR
jgi:FkbM family methyltransferase